MFQEPSNYRDIIRIKKGFTWGGLPKKSNNVSDKSEFKTDRNLVQEQLDWRELNLF